MQRRQSGRTRTMCVPVCGLCHPCRGSSRPQAGAFFKKPRMNSTDIKEHITAAKDEIIAEIRKDKRSRGRPKNAASELPRSRGPKNTRMMKVERKEVITYLEIECHRTIDSCTLSDCTYVWNRPENKTLFNRAATATDSTRGYPNPAALCSAITYHHNLDILRAQRKRAGLRTK